MKYLINPLRTKRKAHLWNGSDTACRMGSTGGLRMSEYAVVEDKEGRQVCSICEQISAAQARSSGEGPLPDSLWRAAMSVYHREIRRNPGNAWQAVCTEVLRLGGCARDQSTTQYCAEAARLVEESERLRAALEDIAYPNPLHNEDDLMRIARVALAQEPKDDQ